MPNERIFRGTPEAEAARRAYEASLPAQSAKSADDVVQAAWLRELCMWHGAEDVGFVEVSRPGLGPEGENARQMLPAAKSLIALVAKLNPTAARVPSRTVANVSSRHSND